jgi:IMP dehydrogenase/GMP reductase
MKFINARGESYHPTSFLSFNDVLLRPQKSRFDSRNSPSINIGGSILDLEESDHYSLNLEVKYSIPIISANMDTVTGPTMAIEMNRLGGIGILHRFYKDLKVYAQDIVNVNNALGYVAFSVGIGQKWKDFINHLYKNHFTQYNQPSLLVCIDVAHGHMDGVREMIDHLQNMPSGIHSTIIAGNVATARGARDLVDAGAKIAKVGIGGGCFTGETKVRTSRGIKNIRDIVPGDSVLTHTGSYQTVVGTTSKKEDYFVKINGVESTANHEYYVLHKKYVSLVTDDNIHEYAEFIPANDLTDDYLLIKCNI